MSERPLSFAILGLSITSAWGNGHATTYRALVRELCRRGHRVTFLERDVPWYAANRDLPEPPDGRTVLYRSLGELEALHLRTVADADVVIVGSYVPEGAAVGAWALARARGVTAFYDIDTPVTVEALRGGTCAYVTRALVPRYGLYLSSSGGPILRALETEFGAAAARPLYCAVDPELYRPDDGGIAYDLGYLGAYSPDRQPALERLLLRPARRWPEGRFVIAGPQYPPYLGWPPNVERVEHLAPAAHRRFYNAQRFTLSVTRAALAAAGHSPSARLFEAAACGTAIVTDRWTGLSEFFAPGEEILVADSAEEALAFLRGTPEPSRRRLGERARRRVLAEHTAARRAAELEGYVRERLAGSAARAEGGGRP